MKSQASKLISPFFIKNYQLASVEPKFLLLHMMCAILRMIFYFVFACCFNKILRYESFWLRESPQIATYLLNYSLDLHLYLFGVACHLLLCFTYILWVNCWINWISWSWNHIMPSGGFTLGLESEIFWGLTITILVIQAIHE